MCQAAAEWPSTSTLSGRAMWQVKMPMTVFTTAVDKPLKCQKDALMLSVCRCACR